MPLMKLPEPSGKCEYCGINKYSFKGEEPKPVIWPCGIYREKGDEKIKREFRCPWETKEQQDQISIVKPDEVIAGLLGTQFGSGLDD